MEAKEMTFGELTKRQAWIVWYLAGRTDFVSPSEIGIQYGLHKYRDQNFCPHSYHSAMASPVCLQLVKLGILKRNKRGWYKLISK